ncbi:FkbM family methyltransferase [Brevundimonas olei]|uniref:FkbM family methyltransferase n=1 Tax=Brevundimonas olei TaxID=657642 RepID=UPI0031E2BD4F
MSDLLPYIERTPLSRTVWTDDLVDKLAAFVYAPQDALEALAWFREGHGRDPDFIVSDKPIDLETAAPRIAFKEVRKHAGAYPLVYWRNCRRLVLKLARHGVQTLRFSHDPAYKKVKFDPNFLNKYRDEMESLFRLLADEESRLTLASVIKYRLTGDHGYLRMAAYPEYEHPIVKAEPGEWVIDCGASNGATSFRFAKRVGPKGAVYAFEPDPTNVRKIEETVAKTPKGIDNLVVVNAAVSNENGVIRFAGDQGGSSRISPDGNIEVAVRTLDDFAQSTSLSGPGVISFDVEGFEHQALDGGVNLIRNLRPKLQISAYHKVPDLHSLAFWVRDTLPDYAFFMGHHESYHTETDIYAIPKERLPA